MSALFLYRWDQSQSWENTEIQLKTLRQNGSDQGLFNELFSVACLEFVVEIVVQGSSFFIFPPQLKTVVELWSAEPLECVAQEAIKTWLWNLIFEIPETVYPRCYEYCIQQISWKFFYNLPQYKPWIAYIFFQQQLIYVCVTHGQVHTSSIFRDCAWNQVWSEFSMKSTEGQRWSHR